ncbi:MAG: hypothetical protein WC648_05415 [Candidatus Paceibacterota bacterium]|jgi:hypothetical protein
MTENITPTIALLGRSDIAYLGIDPRRSGDLSEWRAMREKRGHSIASEFSQEQPHVIASIRKGAAKRPSKPRAWRPIMEGRNRAAQAAVAELVNARRSAEYEMWEAVMEARDGLYSITAAAIRVRRARTCVKDAVRDGHIKAVEIDCPPRGRPLKMVRLEDVVARFGMP